MHAGVGGNVTLSGVGLRKWCQPGCMLPRVCTKAQAKGSLYAPGSASALRYTGVLDFPCTPAGMTIRPGAWVLGSMQSPEQDSSVTCVRHQRAQERCVSESTSICTQQEHPRSAQGWVCSAHKHWGHLQGSLNRCCSSELGQQAGVDVEGSPGGDVQEGLRQDVAIGSCHAQVRALLLESLQEVWLATDSPQQ